MTISNLGELCVEFKKDWKKLPNLITELRLILCPLPGILILFSRHNLELRIVALISFLVITATDMLDGYLARTRNEITDLGSTLDPCVDKLLSVLTLVALSILAPNVWYLTVFIVMRESSVAWTLRRARKSGVNVEVNFGGKIKTFALAAAMGMLFLPFEQVEWDRATIIVVGVACVVSLISWMQYIILYAKPLKK
jgi:CDP-diacylglycerol--glycerol-3-phosphate 3-phosphatidyltransferase